MCSHRYLDAGVEIQVRRHQKNHLDKYNFDISHPRGGHRRWLYLTSEVLCAGEAAPCTHWMRARQSDWLQHHRTERCLDQNFTRNPMGNDNKGSTTKFESKLRPGYTDPCISGGNSLHGCRKSGHFKLISIVSGILATSNW